MHEIICPHCTKAFKIDETGYADILKQVRDHEFEQQLNERLELAEKDKQNAVELAKTKAVSGLNMATAAKDAEIQKLQAMLDAGDVEKTSPWRKPEASWRNSATRSQTNSSKPRVAGELNSPPLNQTCRR